jgi:hypothetical protein
MAAKLTKSNLVFNTVLIRRAILNSYSSPNRLSCRHPLSLSSACALPVALLSRGETFKGNRKREKEKGKNEVPIKK